MGDEKPRWTLAAALRDIYPRLSAPYGTDACGGKRSHGGSAGAGRGAYFGGGLHRVFGSGLSEYQHPAGVPNADDTSGGSRLRRKKQREDDAMRKAGSRLCTAWAAGGLLQA